MFYNFLMQWPIVKLRFVKQQISQLLVLQFSLLFWQIYTVYILGINKVFFMLTFFTDYSIGHITNSQPSCFLTADEFFKTFQVNFSSR